MSLFLYPVTKVSVRRYFEEYENMKLNHSLLQYIILYIEHCITSCGMKYTEHCWGLRTDNVSKYVLGMYLVFERYFIF
jgi:hypothetical protein